MAAWHLICAPAGGGSILRIRHVKCRIRKTNGTYIRPLWDAFACAGFHNLISKGADRMWCAQTVHPSAISASRQELQKPLRYRTDYHRDTLVGTKILWA